MVRWVVLRCNHYLIIQYFPIFQVITFVKMETIRNSGFVGLNDWRNFKKTFSELLSGLHREKTHLSFNISRRIFLTLMMNIIIVTPPANTNLTRVEQWKARKRFPTLTARSSCLWDLEFSNRDNILSSFRIQIIFGFISRCMRGRLSILYKLFL